MPNSSTLLLGVIAATSIVSHARTRITARKNAQLVIDAFEAYEETQRANEAQIKYLCHMLDENEIPADEFDRIVLNYNQ